MEVVNGYVCKTCSDVALAKKHINPADPAHDVHNPQSADYGKPEDPQKPGKAAPAPAVTFGGALAHVTAAGKAADPNADPLTNHRPYAPGAVLSVSA